MEEKGYAREPKRILYLLVVEEKGYALIPHAIMSIVTSFNKTPASVNLKKKILHKFVDLVAYSFSLSLLIFHFLN